MQLAPVVYFTSKKMPELNGFEYFDNVFVIGGQDTRASEGRSVLGIHGCGALDGKFISSNSEAQQALKLLGHKRLPEIGQELKGSLTLYVTEERRQLLTVLADPLGGGLVYVHRDSDGCGVSSDLSALVSFLTLIGKKQEKSLAYVASYVATGSGGLIPSSYENINVLTQFSFMEISPQGAEIREYSCKSDFFDSDASYEERLRAARDEISVNIDAVANADRDRKVAHLTGGIDSRIMLAAILDSGYKDLFAFFCSGGPTEPDKVVASKLASEFDLTMTEHSGLESYWAPETLEQQLLLPFIETAGIISGVVQRGSVKSSALIASGGYGELLRSFYNKGQKPTSTYSSAEKMYGRLAFSEDSKRRLFSDEFATKGLRSLDTAFNEARNAGVRPDAEMDYVYLNRRNRYYVGELSRSSSSYTPRFDPLYSLHGASLAMHIEGVSRDANIIGFDLMDSFNPRLSRLPFDRDRYTGSYAQVRSAPDMMDFSSNTPVRFDGVTRTPLENRASIATLRPSPADIKRANALRMSPRLVAQGPHIQQGAQEILRGMPQHHLDSVFNPTALTTLLAKEPAHRLYYRTARDLYAGLLWYAKG